MAYTKQQWNQYDKSKSIEENIENDAVVTPSKLIHIEEGFGVLEQDVAEALANQREAINNDVDNRDVVIDGKLALNKKDAEDKIKIVDDKVAGVTKSVTDNKTANDQVNSIQDTRVLKLEDITSIKATNIIDNGDFSKGLDTWITVNATATVANNTLTNKANGSALIGQTSNALGTKAKIVGNKYYYAARMRTLNTAEFMRFRVFGPTQDTGWVIAGSVIPNTWSRFSRLLTATDTTPVRMYFQHGYSTVEASLNKVMEIKDVIALDLTETFGAGNEPSVEQMDKILSQFTNSWFDGVKNLFVAKEVLNRTLKTERELNMNATNQIINGDFKKGTDNWILGALFGTTEGNELELTVATIASIGNTYVRQDFKHIMGNKYYAAFGIKPKYSRPLGFFAANAYVIPSNTIPVAGIWNNYSTTYNAISDTNGLFMITHGTTSDYVVGDKYSIRNVIRINLTETFGAGNEPTQSQMDRLLAQYPNSWFDGTQNLFNARTALAEMRDLDNKKANKQQSDWINLPTSNGAITEAYYPIQVRLDEFGVVHLRGLLKNLVTGSVVFTLPVGYRPDIDINTGSVRFVLQRKDGSNVAALQINYVGGGYINLPSNELSVFLDNVSFTAKKG